MGQPQQARKLNDGTATHHPLVIPCAHMLPDNTHITIYWLCITLLMYITHTLCRIIFIHAIVLFLYTPWCYPFSLCVPQAHLKMDHPTEVSVEVHSSTKDTCKVENKINKAEVAQPHAIYHFLEEVQNVHACQCHVMSKDIITDYKILILLHEWSFILCWKVSFDWIVFHRLPLRPIVIGDNATNLRFSWHDFVPSPASTGL